MAAFGSQCSSSGTLTNAALESVISSIKNDPLCKGVASDSLDTDLQQNMQSKFSVQSQQQNEQQIQNSINDLNAAMQAEEALPNPDPVYIEDVQTDLYTSQTQLIQAKQTLNQQQSQLSSAQVLSISNHGTAFMDALSANSACLNAHPNAVAQVGAQVLKLSSNWAPGIMGSAMLATGGLIDHFVQAINTASVNQKLKQIADSRLQHALGCTFEGLASTYCQSRDILLVEKANRKAQEEIDPCDSVTQGINLLTRDLSAFQTFVTNIYAGSQPSSPGTAAEKIGVAALQAQLQSLGYTLAGDTAKYQKNYDTSPTQAGKDNAVRSLIRQLSADVRQNLNSSTTTVLGNTNITTGPIGDNFPDPVCGPTAFYYTNGQQNSCTTNQSDAASSFPCETCIARTYFNSNSTPPLPPITQLPANSISILALGATYVQQQELLYKQDNPQSALTSSETFGANLRRGRQFLENANTYLLHLMSTSGGINSGQMKKSIASAQQQVASVIQILDTSSADPNADAGQINVQLEAILAPSTDQAYIPAEIQMIVKQDIDNRMSTGKIDPALAAILQTSTSDSLSELLDNYASLEALRNQVRDAQQMTKANLNAMGLLFEAQIESMAQNLSDALSRNPKDENLKDDLSLFCIQTLLVPSLAENAAIANSKDQKKKGKTSTNSADIAAICKDQVYKSIYTKAHMDLNYNQLAAQPFESRACSLYDFYRKAQLYGNGVPHVAGSAK